MIAHLSKPEYVHVLLNSLPVYGLILPLPAEELRRKVALSDIYPQHPVNFSRKNFLMPL